MSRWPMCTPSNVPTVTTAPSAICGNPAGSCIAQHQPGLENACLVVGNGNQLVRIEQRDTRCTRAIGDRISVHDARTLRVVEPHLRKRRNRVLERAQRKGTTLDFVEWRRLLNRERAGSDTTQRGQM